MVHSGSVIKWSDNIHQIIETIGMFVDDAISHHDYDQLIMILTSPSHFVLFQYADQLMISHQMAILDIIDYLIDVLPPDALVEAVHSCSDTIAEYTLYGLANLRDGRLEDLLLFFGEVTEDVVDHICLIVTRCSIGAADADPHPDELWPADSVEC